MNYQVGAGKSKLMKLKYLINNSQFRCLKLNSFGYVYINCPYEDDSIDKPYKCESVKI